jgi:hypothetical protein
MRLADDERELLLAEVAQALDQVRAPELKVAYGELLTAVDAGEVPDELLEPLQNLLEVGLESGRIRRLHTAHGEMAANRVFSRTPQGRVIRNSVEAVNEALAALNGHELVEATLTPAGPGSYTLTVVTDQGRLLIRLGRQGATLHSVEVG